MWKCPKCGRSFKNENQQHFCGKAPETIDDYILAQDESIWDQLRNVREVLRDELPNATEKISWSMPTYWMGHKRSGGTRDTETEKTKIVPINDHMRG